MTPTKRTPSTLHRLLSQGGVSLTCQLLENIRCRSYRNHTWARLKPAERGVFRCALWITKARGRITNIKLVEQVTQVALRLIDTIQSRITRAGRTKAMMMFREYARPEGVFSWAPKMRTWLCDPGYIMYLGILEVNH